MTPTCKYYFNLIVFLCCGIFLNQTIASLDRVGWASAGLLLMPQMQAEAAAEAAAKQLGFKGLKRSCLDLEGSQAAAFDRCVAESIQASKDLAGQRKAQKANQEELIAAGKPIPEAQLLKPFAFTALNDNWTETVTAYTLQLAPFLQAWPTQKIQPGIASMVFVLVDNHYDNIFSLLEAGSRGQGQWSKKCASKPISQMNAKLREWHKVRPNTSMNWQIQSLKDILNFHQDSVHELDGTPNMPKRHCPQSSQKREEGTCAPGDLDYYIHYTLQLVVKERLAL